MLELTAQQEALALAWDKTDLQASLPEDVEEFCEPVGLIPHQPGCRRAHPRFFIRGKAILRWGDKALGVYSADASRSGIRFLSPIELRLEHQGRIRLPNTKEFQIEVVRCHRIDDNCYDCGAVFVLAKPNT